MRELGHVGHHRSLKNYSDVGEEFKYSDPLTDFVVSVFVGTPHRHRKVFMGPEMCRYQIRQ